MPSGLRAGFGKDLGKNLASTLAAQQFSQAVAQVLSLILGSAELVANQLLAIEAGHHAGEHQLIAFKTAVHANRHLTATLQGAQEGAFGQTTQGCGAVLQHLDLLKNSRITITAFDAQGALAHGMQ